VADCRSRPAYEVSYEDYDTKEASSVEVDWMVFCVDKEKITEGVWEVIDKKKKVSFKDIMNEKDINIVNPNKYDQKVKNNFVNHNKYEVLEFEDPQVFAENSNEYKPESPNKTKMTVNNFMKFKKAKPEKTKNKGEDKDLISQVPIPKRRTQGPKEKLDEFPPEMVDPDDGDEEWKTYKRAQVPKEARPLEVNVVEGDRCGKVKRKGKVTIDSGAEVSIWPAAHVAWENVKPTLDSERGIGFVAANGSRMENYGGTQVKFEKDGKVKAMNFEVTDPRSLWLRWRRSSTAATGWCSTRTRAISTTRKLGRKLSWSAKEARSSCWLSSR